MLSNFFILPGRNYLNNAVVIADILSVIYELFGNVTNFNIKFRKPFNTQAKISFSTEPLSGYTIGSFETKLVKFYFAYEPTDIELPNVTLDTAKIDYFNLSYDITDTGRGIVQKSFEKEIGPMPTSDKVIFAICDIPNTTIINDIIKRQVYPKITITEALYIGNRRFKYSVLLDDVFFADRYCTVKEFNV
jgi:hypothetical protein